MISSQLLHLVGGKVDSVLLRRYFFILSFIADAAGFISGQSKAVAMNSMIIKEELLIKRLIEVFASTAMFNLHVVFDLVKTFSNDPECLVVFRFDDEFVPIEGFKDPQSSQPSLPVYLVGQTAS